MIKDLTGPKEQRDKNQLDLARQGVVTPQMQRVACDEQCEVEQIRGKVALGEIVIPNNPNRADQKIVGIGAGLRSKINASIGTSSSALSPSF